MSNASSGSQKPPLGSRPRIGSKWTALAPVDREKHFLVVGQRRTASGIARERELELQAVTSKRTRWIAPEALEDETQWARGWR
ncbi:MAG: TIGR02450 family Trp-rich protein [Myxococcota bacterium]